MALAAVRSFFFRKFVSCFLSLESRWLSRLHEDYRRAIVRALLGLKRRTFPSQGGGTLAAQLKEGTSPVHATTVHEIPVPRAFRDVGPEVVQGLSAGSALDTSLRTLLAHATRGGDYEPWLWLEQENLLPVARHLDLGRAQWTSLPMIEKRPAGIATPNLDAVISLLPARGLSHVLLLPWLKPGGADKAALCYLEALGARNPGRVIAITTEAVDSPWRERVPSGVVLVDWARLEPWQDSEAALQGLLNFLQKARVEVLHVMNSFLGWELLKRHGLRVRALTRVFASLFWYGPSKHDRLCGYASEYLPLTIDYLDGVITDNRRFAAVLCDDYGFSRDLFHCVYHPTAQIVDISDGHPLPRFPFPILWASRFAPEKRIDILAEIAERRPDLEFHVYGGQSDLPPDLHPVVTRLSSLPNVHLRGEFNGFESLSLSSYGLFLYTSSSDGMPNVVIEAMAHGLPVVAPDVGGIGELVDSDTGWLVPHAVSANAYLAALDAALAERVVSENRRRAGIARIRERHRFEVFSTRLEEVPGYLSAWSGARP